MDFQATGAVFWWMPEGGKPQLFTQVLGSDLWSREHPKTRQSMAGFTQHLCSEGGSRPSPFPCRSQLLMATVATPHAYREGRNWEFDGELFPSEHIRLQDKILSLK